jgi:hypothetical protein
MDERVTPRPRRLHRHCLMGWAIRGEAKAKFVLASGGDPDRTLQSVTRSGAGYSHRLDIVLLHRPGRRGSPTLGGCRHAGISDLRSRRWRGEGARSEPRVSASAALTAPRSWPPVREGGRRDGPQSPAAWHAAGACKALRSIVAHPRHEHRTHQTSVSRDGPESTPGR